MTTDMTSTIKTALESHRYPFTLSGAVLFGSRADGRHTDRSDVDLLVVAENINPRLHRRKKEILEIKRSLPGLPLDVLLLSPAEVVSNFTNHNPLFLSIAEDGVILTDTDNFLFDLMRRTREYVAVKGIRRIADGWRFPVAHRAATALSGVSNKDFSEAMLNDGERDFSIGTHLLQDEFFDKSVYHFQQSAEKCVKSILIAFGTFQKTHFIGNVLVEEIRGKSLPDDWKKRLSDIAELSGELEPEMSLSRYPGIINDALWMPAEEYDQEDAEDSLKKAELVLTVAKDFFNYWFLEEEDAPPSEQSESAPKE